MSTEVDSELLEYIETHNVNGGYWGADHAAIAKKIMVAFVKNGGAEFLLLKDDQVSKWWGSVVNEAQRAIERRKADLEKRKEAIRIYKIKMAAYERLDAAERKALGMLKPRKPSGYDESKG